MTRLLRSSLLTPALALTLAASAAAQNFNIDIGATTGNVLPSAAFGAGAARPGTWTTAKVQIGTPSALTDVSGGATAVTMVMSAGTLITSTLNLVGATADNVALMTDIQDPATTATWTINNLAPGGYDIYTYAMAPDDGTFLTRVSIAGSADPAQDVGGVWPNAYVLGVTHARHHIVATGAPIVITAAKTPSPPAPATNFASVNGFQIVRDNTGSAFCFGDGIDVSHTTPCPCANNGAAGNGCANSTNAAGANLTASGSTTLDNVVLAGSGMPATVSCIYLQGDALDDVTFGDGVRCTGGSLIRLRTRANVGGASTFPDSTDTITLSARGGVTPGSGALRFYQTYYRNSAATFCPPETFNVTNGWQITW
jgi:hypothetical protein